MNVYERIRKRISENTKLKVKRQMQGETLTYITGMVCIIVSVMICLLLILKTH